MPAKTPQVEAGFNYKIMPRGYKKDGSFAGKVFIKGQKHPPFSKEHRKKISEWMKGNKNWERRKNFKHSEETKKKMSEAKKGKPSCVLGKHWKRKTYKGKPFKKHKHKRYIHLVGTTKYRNWRMVIFKRDNFMCVSCQKVGGYLMAHHIKSWAKYPKLRYKINNGITLCKECHKIIHKIKIMKEFIDLKNQIEETPTGDTPEEESSETQDEETPQEEGDKSKEVEEESKETE